jgi:hypothetical protein
MTPTKKQLDHIACRLLEDEQCDLLDQEEADRTAKVAWDIIAPMILDAIKKGGSDGVARVEAGTGRD